MLRPLLAAGLVGLLALAGCGGDEPDAAASSSAAGSTAGSTTTATTAGATGAPASATATPTSYLPVPAGVTLTDQGGALALGAPATVAWQPQQDVVGVLGATVDQLQRTTLQRSFTGWQIPAESRTATPYFVRATLTNAGGTDLSGQAVPLYAATAAGTLVEPTTFASAFKPCRDGVLPAAFAPGATAQVCLVFFVPEGTELTGVSFRPTQEFEAITWSGAIDRVKARKKA